MKSESGRDHNLPAGFVLTFIEASHTTHYAWPDSARPRLEHGQPDLGWLHSRGLARLGLVWDLKNGAGGACRLIFTWCRFTTPMLAAGKSLAAPAPRCGQMAPKMEAESCRLSRHRRP